MKIDEEVAGINICTKKLKTVSENMGHSETIWHAQPKNLILAEVFHMFQNCKILYRLSEEKNLKQSVLKIPGGGPKRFDASTLCSTLLGSAFHARQTLIWLRI